MKNFLLRARLHRYKRNLFFPCFVLIFVFSNLIGCTQILPIEEEQEIHGSIDSWDENDSVYHSKTDSGRPMNHEDSIKFGYFN